MIRILIADDEEIERVALEKILTTHLPQIEVVAKAMHGRDAIEKAEQTKPDLLLMDIQMPGINGLEAIEIIREKFPEMKVVIVSSYDTFTYAQQAIRLGVKDYLLKPSKVKVIIDTIRKICEEIKQERAKRESQDEMTSRIQKALPIIESECVSQLLFDQVHPIDQEEMSKMIEVPIQPPAYVIAMSIQPKEMEHRPAITKMIQEMKIELCQHGSILLGSISGSVLPLILFHKKGQERHQAMKLVEQIRRISYRDSKVNILIGIGRSKTNLVDLRLSYQEALLACSDSIAGQGFRSRFYEDLAREQGEDSKRLHYERKLINSLRDEKWQDTKEILLRLLSVDEQRQTPVGEAKQRLYGHLLLIIHLLDEMGVEAIPSNIILHGQTYAELWQEAREKIQELDVVYQRFQQHAQYDTLDQVKKYIEEHFTEDLSLEQLAQMVNLSPFYLSKCFKEEFGISYVDYMTQCRIYRAKEYIRQGGLSFKEIAYSVGYHDPNYFSRVFKKVCGLSPSQYRDRK